MSDEIVYCSRKDCAFCWGGKTCIALAQGYKNEYDCKFFKTKEENEEEKIRLGMIKSVRRGVK